MPPTSASVTPDTSTSHQPRWSGSALTGTASGSAEPAGVGCGASSGGGGGGGVGTTLGGAVSDDDCSEASSLRYAAARDPSPRASAARTARAIAATLVGS